MRRSILLAGLLTVCVAVMGLLTVQAHPLYSDKHASYLGVAIYCGVPFAYDDTISQGINQYQSGSYTVVTEDNWSSVVPDGLSGYPQQMEVFATAYLVDMDYRYWTVPNNYPYCFVDAQDAYACGDSRAIQQYVYNRTNTAYAEVDSYVFTFDDYNSYLAEYPTWRLTTF